MSTNCSTRLVIALHPVEQTGERGIVVVVGYAGKSSLSGDRAGAVRLRNSLEQRQRLKVIPTIHQQLSERHNRVFVACFDLQRNAERALRRQPRRVR